METLGKRLRYLRENILKLTTPKLAEQLQALGVVGASAGSVSRYETGVAEPGAGYLRAMAELCDETADWILGLPANGHAIDRSALEEVAEAIERWKQLRSEATSPPEAQPGDLPDSLAKAEIDPAPPEPGASGRGKRRAAGSGES